MRARSNSWKLGGRNSNGHAYPPSFSKQSCSFFSRMIQKQGVLSLGNELPQPKGLGLRRVLWYALGLVALGSVYHITNSTKPTHSRLASDNSVLSTWPTTDSAGLPNGRVHSFNGPARSWLEDELLDSLTNQTTRKIPSHQASLARQAKLCPNSALQADVLQLDDFGSWWESVTETELGASRYRLAEAVAAGFGFNLDGDPNQKLSDSEWELMFGDGRRGIVYSKPSGEAGSLWR